MITISDNGMVEIRPVNNGTSPEVLIIDTSTRKVSNIHIHEPRGTDKYAKMVKSVERHYGFTLSCMVLEITNEPTKASNSMKTLTHSLIYYNIIDLQKDFETLRKLIIGG